MTSFHKTLIYISFLVALALNANFLISTLHPDVEVIMDVPWTFNLFEFLYRTAFTWVSYIVLGILFWNLNSARSLSRKERIQKIIPIILFFAASLLVGLYSQKYIFDNMLNSQVYTTGSILRFTIGTGLIYVLVRVLRISNDRKAKELENEQLNSAYADAQLKNLRAQINPHFLFNAFTNLSGLMVEDVDIAQKYVGNLSRIFRYSLAESASPLVDLSKELELLEAHIELLKIRYQDNLHISIEIEHADLYKIPVMSLQPLLDNVTKHNIISEVEPGSVSLIIKDDELYFSSTITIQKTDVPSNGIGLYNLNERFKLLLDKEIKIEKSNTEFTVILPLIKKNKHGVAYRNY